MSTPRMRASQRNGVLGGHARVAATTPEQRQAWGEKAGNALLTRYGPDFFRHMARERWRKHNEKKKRRR
jgi:hypothetical protein